MIKNHIDPLETDFSELWGDFRSVNCDIQFQLLIVSCVNQKNCKQMHLIYESMENLLLKCQQVDCMRNKNLTVIYFNYVCHWNNKKIEYKEINFKT